MRSNRSSLLAIAGAAGLLAGPAAGAEARTEVSPVDVHARAHARELAKTTALESRLMTAEHRHVPAHWRSVAAVWDIRTLRAKQASLRTRIDAARYPVPTDLRGPLAAIASCESHSDPRAIGGGGAYRGKYQFSFGTWASVGGSGDPAAASEREQDFRAAKLYRREGAGQWPVCGR